MKGVTKLFGIRAIFWIHHFLMTHWRKNAIELTSRNTICLLLLLKFAFQFCALFSLKNEYVFSSMDSNNFDENILYLAFCTIKTDSSIKSSSICFIKKGVKHYNVQNRPCTKRTSSVDL